MIIDYMENVDAEDMTYLSFMSEYASLLKNSRVKQEVREVSRYT